MSVILVILVMPAPLFLAPIFTSDTSDTCANVLANDMSPNTTSTVRMAADKEVILVILAPISWPVILVTLETLSPIFPISLPLPGVPIPPAL